MMHVQETRSRTKSLVDLTTLRLIVIEFVIAAIITPPDPLSQLILAVPLCLLYVVSIGVAYVFGRRDAPLIADE
jgi:Sec-independent protein secretion pathway component TatC